MQAETLQGPVTGGTMVVDDSAALANGPLQLLLAPEAGGSVAAFC